MGLTKHGIFDFSSPRADAAANRVIEWNDNDLKLAKDRAFADLFENEGAQFKSEMDTAVSRSGKRSQVITAETEK
ncbi:MAG: hypothetical protein HUJ56_01750 [Erysipelotrichaceae bacterium]|nr:hypothetical protein [Erysipelotrichaceae bacterium]